MSRNVFFKSVLRQPIRAFILAILVGAAAFAFVARATEFAVVRDELTRIESFYRAVGVLSPTSFDNFTVDHDVTRALEIVEGSRHVAISDTRIFTQGVLADMINMATHPVGQHYPYFNPILHGVDISMGEHFFIANLRTIPRLLPHANPPELLFVVNIYELIIGDPGIIRTEDRIFTNDQGQTVTFLANENMRLVLTEEERDLFQQDLWHPLGDMQVGDYALFRVTPRYVPPADPWTRSQMYWYVRPLIGRDGLQHTWVERDYGGDVYRIMPGVGGRDNWSDLVFYVDAMDEVALSNMLDYLQDELALISQNLSSVTVTATKDMTEMPRFTDSRVARLLDTPAFPAGRWLTYDDYLQGNHVVVIPIPFATRRGLNIGDSITITFRDNPRPNWIDIPTESTWARGIENWWDNSPSGWWGMIDGAHEDWQDFTTNELTLEVVGIYWFFPPVPHNFVSAEMFIPAGLIPGGGGWDDAPLLTGMYSFILDSPRSEERFLRETQTELYDMGFTAMFIPNGFDTLSAATDPIRFSITVNLVVFGVVSALILAFVVLLYLRHWRKSVAIAQALGIPRRNVLCQLFAPVVVFWVPSMIIGGLIAWFFALAQSEATLATIVGHETAIMPGIHLLLLFCGMLIVFVLLGVWYGGYNVVCRPVLVQLQGETQKRRKVDYINSGVVPEGLGVAFADIEITPPAVSDSFGTKLRASLRYCTRHVFRTPIKTTLALLLAIIFVFSLGWLNNMIYSTDEEIERLWATTIIEAEINRGFVEGEQADVTWPAPISDETWNAVVFSGFLGDAYLESIFYFAWSDDRYFGVSDLDSFIVENTKTLIDEQLGIICADMEIEFFGDFSLENFAFVPGDPIPLIIRRGMYTSDIYWWMSDAIADGQDVSWVMGDPEGNPQDMQVIGVFDGGLQRAINRFGEDNLLYIMPLDALRFMFYDVLAFVVDQFGRLGSFGTYPPLLTARFTIDPARNREIDQFRDLMQPALNHNFMGSVPLQLHIDDDVIHNVIIPMEQSLSLLRVLYPIAIGVAFLLSLGLSLLTMLQNAKNAAIMRVLGKPRTASRFMLCTEQLMVCVAGIFIGLVVLLITGTFMGVTPLLLAGVYLGGALIGSVIGAFVISMRAPLDLLQVRE